MCTLFHLSDKNYLTKLKPRVPECAISGHEDLNIPRVCCGSKIGYCLNSLSPMVGEQLYVYEVLVTDQTCILKPKQIECMVRDAGYTKENWILNQVDVKLIGQIQVVCEGKCDQFLNKYGQQFTGTYGIKWIWLNKQ